MFVHARLKHVFSQQIWTESQLNAWNLKSFATEGHGKDRVTQRSSEDFYFETALPWEFQCSAAPPVGQIATVSTATGHTVCGHLPMTPVALERISEGKLKTAVESETCDILKTVFEHVETIYKIGNSVQTGGEEPKS